MKHLKIEDKLHRQLRTRASSLGMTPQDLLNSVIAEYLAELGKKQLTASDKGES